MSSDPTLGLIAEAARGNRTAAGQLLEPLLPRVRNLVRYLTRGDSEVDDIAQQCLVAILRGLGQYRGDGSFLAWVDRVTVRRTFLELKKERKRRAAWADVPAVEFLEGEGADPYLRRRDVVRLLDQLPDEQRRAIVLHHAVGFSISEVAELLGIPFDTAKSRIRLGIKKLRSMKETEV